jgi:precorrin-2 dehydrogenase / sirohydrochlorin ferrochelatase
MKYYPIAISLKNKKVVIVGGGFVAERKILNLLAGGACVTVISPVLTKTLAALVKKCKIKHVNRIVRHGDIVNADIVIAATSDHAVNKKVSEWSRRAGAWVNTVDNKLSSDFISPAVFQKQKAIVAVYTDGEDPGLSRDLKNFLSKRWDEFLSFRRVEK